MLILNDDEDSMEKFDLSLLRHRCMDDCEELKRRIHSYMEEKYAEFEEEQVH